MVASIIIIAYLIYWTYFNLFKKKYTRERYAFLSTKLLFSLLVFIVPYLWGENIVILLLNYILEFFEQTTISSETITIYDKFIALVIIVLFYLHIRSTFNNWNGNVSNRQYKLDLNHISTTFLSEANYYRQNKNNTDVKIYNPEEDNSIDKIFPTSELPQIPWNNQVADLLVLNSKKYKINKNNDWREKEKYFL